MGPDDGARLLTAVWAGASGLVEARAIGPGPVRRSFLPLAEAVARLPGWRRWCDAHDRSLYFGVLPRIGRDGTKAGIAPGAVAWADLDGKDYPGGLGECHDRAQRSPLAPSAVVASARRENHVLAIKSKGMAEINKVASAVARLLDQADAKAERLDGEMALATSKRSAVLGEVAAKCKAAFEAQSMDMSSVVELKDYMRDSVIECLQKLESDADPDVSTNAVQAIGHVREMLAN